MISYEDWIFDPIFGHIKMCIENPEFDILLYENGYGWCPMFSSICMANVYKKYNPIYYTHTTLDNIDAAKQIIDQFIQKYNKLLVFM